MSSSSSSSQNGDCLVVGQGLVGTVLAHELECQGLRPVVIDKSFPNSASKVAAGLFNPFVFKWITMSWNADELLPALRQTYREIEKVTGEAFFHETGIIRIIASLKEADSWAKKRNRPDFAVHIDESMSASIDSRFDKGWGAVAIKSAGWLDISLMIESFRSYLLKDGRFIDALFQHDKLEHGDVCRYNGNTYKFVVFCEGARVADNPWFHQLNYRHTKGEVLDISEDALELSTCLNYGQFIVPRGRGVFRTGTTYNWEELNDIPSKAAEEKILRNHLAFFGHEPKVIGHRAGVRPTSADRRPFVGRHHQFRNLSILNATGSKGVLLAPWSAQQLVAHLVHEKPLHPEIDLKRIIE